jgi:DNA-binding CsgD family transcriptional regulator
MSDPKENPIPPADFSREYWSTLVGKNVRYMRLKNGISMAKMATLMTELGCPMTYPQISHMERGVPMWHGNYISVTVERLAAMARILKTHPVNLLEPPTPEVLSSGKRKKPVSKEQAAKTGETPVIAKRVSSSRLVYQGSQLSAVEVEVMGHIASGNTAQDTATKMFLSENTVKTHLKAIYLKLGVGNAAHASALLLVTDILRRDSIQAGEVPLDDLRKVNDPLIFQEEYNVLLGSSLKLALAELQFTESGPDTDGVIWSKLAGWLTNECPSLHTIQQSRLTGVLLSRRRVPVGQTVFIRVRKYTNEYNLGQYVTVRWPKHGKIES